MRWTSDDFDESVMGAEMAMPNYPVEFELMDFCRSHGNGGT
jgi:hypothetical protein